MRAIHAIVARCGSAIAIAIAVAGGTVPASAQSADPKKGRDVYLKVGCWGCHGFNGHGAVTGPKIAPDPLPLEAFIVYLRNAAKTRMPPYNAAALPDADVAHVHAYLVSQPKPQDWRTIPLLKR